ncbi:MerR family transcriptional regulator [Reinekea blandensis]|uniref:Transcriptional regulator n=1 Tax=Reinekea blandensis MED297 TaxID=314283 RepID=A4BFB2_9GAMM|nr:MerR family transcriptional regulator [Reinekea blandensis]EAR09225.1 transcriptional regulator [Reinekea sp. MED297] [Reinekea blandensis MED297]
MTTYTISQAAQASGISVRTLHHYDAIQLLVPSRRSDNGYRRYTEADLNRLADILFYRALGFSLKQIDRVLKDQTDHRVTLLREQKQRIDEHIARLQAMREQLVINLEQEENTMKTKDMFNALNGFDPDQYEEEVQQRWGGTDAYKESAQRTKHYDKEDWARYQRDADALNQNMATLIQNGYAATSDEAVAVVEQMRQLIDTWFYPCSRAMHAQLGEMYVMDERFSASYDNLQPGLARFIMQATAANLAKNGE